MVLMVVVLVVMMVMRRSVGCTGRGDCCITFRRARCRRSMPYAPLHRGGGEDSSRSSCLCYMHTQSIIHTYTHTHRAGGFHQRHSQLTAGRRVALSHTHRGYYMCTAGRRQGRCAPPPLRQKTLAAQHNCRHAVPQGAAMQCMPTVVRWTLRLLSCAWLLGSASPL